MRKGHNEGNKNWGGGKRGKKWKRLMEIVATLSLPAAYRPIAGTPHADANSTLALLLYVS